MYTREHQTGPAIIVSTHQVHTKELKDFRETQASEKPQDPVGCSKLVMEDQYNLELV